MAKAAGIPLDTYKKYEGGGVVPGGDALAGLIRAGIDVADLLIGDRLRSLKEATHAAMQFAVRRSGISSKELGDIQEAAFRRGLDAEAVEREFGASFPIQHMAREPGAGYAYIPLYDVRARGGASGSIVDGESVVDVLAFKEEWIRQELHVAPGDLRLIFVEGDSMVPDLHPGDIILIDHTDTAARREGAYVIRMDGALLVKSLQRLPGGVIKVISRNPAYEPFTVNIAALDGSKDFAIVGRVVWGCRRF